MSAKRKKKTLEQQSFFTALKLIAIRQNGKPLENYAAELKCEQPLPLFKREDLTHFKSQLKESVPEKPEAMTAVTATTVAATVSDAVAAASPASTIAPQDITICIPQSEYVKSGYFGMSSYTVYRIETKVSVREL